MLRLSFNVPMTPVAWARAGSNGKHRFTPERAAKAKKTIRDYGYAAMHPRKPTPNPVVLAVRFIFPTPASWPKAKRAAAFEKRLLHTQKPDLSNLIKLVEDALIGIVFVDDAQVVTLDVHKNWGGVGRIEIEVSDIAGAELFQ